MKRNYLGKNVLLKSVALCCAMVCIAGTSYAAEKKSDKPAKSDQAAQSNEQASRISVTRTASVGSGVDVDLSIDGKRVKTLLQGSRYSGTLTPGKHTISVMPKPNTLGQREERMEITAEKGHSFAFTIGHDKSGKLVLQKKS